MDLMFLYPRTPSVSVALTCQTHSCLSCLELNFPLLNHMLQPACVHDNICVHIGNKSGVYVFNLHVYMYMILLYMCIYSCTPVPVRVHVHLYLPCDN